MGTNLLSEFRGRCADYCLVIACLSIIRYPQKVKEPAQQSRGICWRRFVIANAHRHSSKNSIHPNPIFVHPRTMTAARGYKRHPSLLTLQNIALETLLPSTPCAAAPRSAQPARRNPDVRRRRAIKEKQYVSVWWPNVVGVPGVGDVVGEEVWVGGESAVGTGREREPSGSSVHVRYGMVWYAWHGRGL